MSKCYICDRDVYFIGDVICDNCLWSIGEITDQQYASRHGISLYNVKVAKNPITFELEITTNKKFSWEKTDHDYRKNIEYKNWRISVFERDKYTCQICNQVGGKLEAHHILKYHNHKNLRYVLDNGITLCKKCHIEYHKNERKIKNG